MLKDDVEALRTIDFALVNGRIPFTEEGLPMGHIYRIENDEIIVDKEVAERLFKKVWTQTDDLENALCMECDERSCGSQSDRLRYCSRKPRSRI